MHGMAWLLPQFYLVVSQLCGKDPQPSTPILKGHILSSEEQIFDFLICLPPTTATPVNQFGPVCTTELLQVRK